MSVKYSKWPYKISTFSNVGQSEIYPNWDFWFEKKPSGNPDVGSLYVMKAKEMTAADVAATIFANSATIDAIKYFGNTSPERRHEYDYINVYYFIYIFN
jgi:hypothetical protein